MKRRVYFIEGDGIGREVWQAARPVLDRAAELAFDNTKHLEWVELLAGKRPLPPQAPTCPKKLLPRYVRQAWP